MNADRRLHKMDANRYEWRDVAGMMATDAWTNELLALSRAERIIREVCFEAIREHLARSEARYQIVSIGGFTAWSNENAQWHRYCDRPAVVYKDSSRHWWLHGSEGRGYDTRTGLRLPVLVRSDGLHVWGYDLNAHRDDTDPRNGRHLPAILASDGRREWLCNGVRHREDLDPEGGPGSVPRLLPAVILANGTCEWWIHNKQLAIPL
jgi:hypothetical protein